MRKIQFYALLALVFGCAFKAQGQQDGEITQYMFNTIFYNPAYAGVEGVTNFSLLHRSQWIGYQATFDPGGAPTSQLFTLNTPVFKLRSGVGFYVLNESLGPLNNLEIKGSYAYHLGLGRDSKLSIGATVGIYSQSIDFDSYRALNPDDELLIGRNGQESQIRPDMALGAYFRTEKYYLGLSFNHVLQSEFDFGVNSIRNALENHAYFTFGYIHKVNFDVTVTPSFLVKTDFNEYNLILGGIVTYKSMMHGGLMFRSSEDANVLLGYNFLKDKSLKVSYAFGYVIQNQDSKQPTSHEIMLGYTLPVAGNRSRKIVRSPRFRY